MLLIDGYNLLYKRADAQDEGQLLELIYDFCRHTQKRAIVVFDGEWEYDGEDDSRELQIRYVQNADDEIMNLAQKYPGSTVVTSDREIQQRVKQFNCDVIKAQDFNPSVPEEPDQKSWDSQISDHEAQEYLDWFQSER